jgi:cytochrome c oxidase cbb3-type subunit 4
MDQGIVGSIFTVIVFVAFAGVCYWAFSSRNKKSFDEAANLVFDDENKANANADDEKKQNLNNKDQES